MRKQLLIVVLAVLALRLPFLNQAVQGDDLYYLYGAEHAQVDPLHPNHAQYPFLGKIVDMQGHPHPPLNAWFLALLIALFNDVKEIPFHAAYLLFSLTAVLSALALARKFSPYPLLATLLFVVTPTFVVNGNSLESDLPFVALWLLSTALFVRAVDRRSYRWLATSSLTLTGAAFAAYQSVVLVPILALYGRKWKRSWIAAITPIVVLGLWQLYERSSTGAMPASVLSGYMQAYGWQALAQKVRNAAALTAHLGWLVFPALWIPGTLAIPVAIGAAFYDPNPLFWASLAIGFGIVVWCLRNRHDFLAQWVLIFFGAALVIFFAGSARYLLPIALPVAILTTRRVRPRWVAIGVLCEAALSISLAIVNYQHWGGYRAFAATLKHDAEVRRVWVNGDWGFRFYLESEGAVPLLQGQAVHPGDVVAESDLGFPIPITTGGGMLAPVAKRTITSVIPLRLIALHGKSAYSTTLNGLRPFDISRAPIDEVRAEAVVEKQPRLSDLPMTAARGTDEQIVSGIYSGDNPAWRWMSDKAQVLLKSPGAQGSLTVRLYIPDQAPGRTVTAYLDDREVAKRTYPGPGSYVLTSPSEPLQRPSVMVTITIDRTFSVPGDARQLGMILSEVSLP